MKPIKLYLILFLALLQLPAYSKEHSGTNLMLLGDSASALGRGGTGVSLFGIDLLYLNPASIAESEQIELGLQYGTLNNDYKNADISFAYPTSYGVLGAGLRWINIPDTHGIESGYMFSFAGAKNITERISLGVSLNYFYGSDPSDTLSFFGLTLGSIYKFNFYKKVYKGFGLFEPRAGASVNAGMNFGDNKELADFNQPTIGYNFIFYKDRYFKTKFINDFSAVNSYKDYPVKFGIESLINNIYIARFGFTAPQTYDYADFTAGAGYKFKSDIIEGDINYSLVHYSNLSFVHYVGLNLKYGQLDSDPPVSYLSASEEYISPNYDGRQDYIIFKPDVTDESRIKGWKLQILDANDNIVREYKLSERDVNESLSFKEFFKRLWQRNESMVVPNSILWDGTDASNNIVADGRYSYYFLAWDARDNISAARTGAIYVDSTSPEAEISADDLLFSPNADGKKDSFNVKLKITTSQDDIWHAGFTDSSGKPVKAYEWNGTTVPKNLSWDGKDNNDIDASEGLYTFFIESTDKAGNSAKAVKKEITLTRKYQTADITCSCEYYSYQRPNIINFYPVISDTKGLLNWKISIETADNELMKEYNGDKDIPNAIQWDALDLKNKKLDDGKYFCKLQTKFDSGNAPESFKKEFTIDSASPKLNLAYSPDIFSPDNDGENDILTISPEAKDATGIKDWSIVIYDQSGRAFKAYSGKSNPPSDIKWDGIGKDNELVESAADFYIEYTATDIAGNTAKTEKIKLPIDVLVIVTERGLKIRISNIEFAFDKAELTGKAFPILNRVSEILDKYDKYKVLIEGHTDDIGEEEYNLKLSESRAKAVMDYLVSKGITESRLSFRGMGETAPFMPNKDTEGRRKNRRVEFVLIKEQPESAQ